MTIHIAFLRGINAIGLSRVQTYIQSGNVLFESEETAEVLRERIEREIEADFGFPVTVVLRMTAELERTIDNCPFREEEIAEAESTAEGESLYVSLLLDQPSKEGSKRLEAFRSESEQFRIVGREVYLLFSRSIRNAKLANHLDKLGVPGTVRNWETINKLATLAKTVEG